MPPHDFAESLAMSHAASDLPFWRDVYECAFPSMLAMLDHRQDGEHQRAGIDRSIVLGNSKQILIDEKVRGRNKKTGKVYEDIALEYLSDKERHIPGWVCKPLRSDYIAYAIAPLGRCYLLPVIPLQNAWRLNGAEWCKQYPEIRAPNKSWVTISVGVPWPELYKALGRVQRITFEPIETEES